MKVHSCSLRSLRGVNYVVVRSDGRFLIQKRCSCAPTNPNMFCIPGGGIEGDEDPHVAVIREAYEETRLTLFNLVPLCDIEYELRGEIVFNRVFWIFSSIHTTSESLEGAMHWMTMEELESIELALGESVLIPLLKEIINGSLV